MGGPREAFDGDVFTPGVLLGVELFPIPDLKKSS